MTLTTLPTMTAPSLARPPGTREEVKRALEDVRRQLDENQGLTLEQKATALKAIQDETGQTVRQLLGEKAFRYYLRAGDARWLQ